MKSRWAIIWAVVLILGGAFLLAQNFGIFGNLSAPVWSVLFAALGVLFLLNFVTAPEQWWSLIPGCILLGLGVTTWLLERGDVPGDLGGGVILLSIGLPFLLIYAVQTARRQKDFWWALIPGGVVTFIAVLTMLSSRINGEIIGTMVLWGIALPFWIVYLANRPKNWWAIIPGGVMVVIGVIPILSLATSSPGILGGVFFLGLAGVFGLIYALNLGSDTAWAMYPALGLLAVGVGVVILGSNWWPIVLIGVGVLLLARAVWPRKKAG